MKIKWWRWWIVPVILSIFLEVLAAKGLGISVKQSSALFYEFELAIAQGYTFLCGLFLGLVWPAALIVHVIWKRRKAKKTTYAKGEEERL